MKSFGVSLLAASILVLAGLIWAAPAQAQNADVVGSWQIITNVQGNENRSTITILEKDGQISGEAAGRGGATPMLDLSYAAGVLKWGIKVPQLGNQVLMTEVTVKGDTLEGAMDTPLGKLPVTGKRLTAAEMERMAAREKALIGDWDMYTEYNGEIMASKVRFAMDEEDDEMAAQIIMRGSRIDVRRMGFDGETLRMSVGIPFVSEEPATLVAKLDETGKKFSGSVDTVFGDLKLTLEMVDTTKLVVPPYDDPKPILGAWTMEAEIDGQTYPAELTVEERDYQLYAIVKSDTGTYESEHMEYKQVGENMGAIRIDILIPDLSPDKKLIEIIVSGDTYEGEEVNSNGAFVVSGARK
ncbi:MAG: hypothetical protein HYV27_13795 [Candidatus Hydrogenedentes bacterium]|nr:hypothetical protein [Candidatus Hydrogenedentota bacterium]